MNQVLSRDPRTGLVREAVASAATDEEVRQACERAAGAAPGLEGLGRQGRAAMLMEMADALSSRGEEVASLADSETAIGRDRLDGELARTIFQLRSFAGVLDEGSYLEATLDSSTDTPMGPRPDLRRMLLPIGPVAVFGASNFPLAFSVPGGDTASALAAGCPVVIKAHPSHPATSRLSYEILKQSAEKTGAPPHTVSLLHGQSAGTRLVEDPHIEAVAFTGSLSGGRALLDVIATRDQPIPFYGELSSLNPIVITMQAAQQRSEQIAAGLVSSFTAGAGQLCTKPGLIFLPEGTAGDDLLKLMALKIANATPQVLLNKGIQNAFEESMASLRRMKGATPFGAQETLGREGYRVSPQLVEVPVNGLAGPAFTEHFGPVAVVARYSDIPALLAALDCLPSSLTFTIHSEPSEVPLVASLTEKVKHRTGRFVFDGYPTGVAVAWAQHHGGPWPASNTLHTSVGATAIRRFLRPMTWQNAPDYVLPPELRADFDGVPRRIDGQLRLAARTS